MGNQVIRICAIAIVCIAIAFGIGMNMEKLKKNTDTDKYFGRHKVEVKDSVFTPEVMLAMGRVSDPQLSPDGTKILYAVTYMSLQQNRGCSNIFVCDATEYGNTHQLTYEGEGVSNARWSKDGKYIYYLSGDQIYRVKFKGRAVGRKHQISKVGRGISAFELSPDGSRIMYISTIPGPVKSPANSDPELGKAKAYVAEDLMYRHWDHWVTETPHTFIAELGKELITRNSSTDILGNEPYELPTEPFGGLEQLSWSPDGKTIAYSCRKLCGKQYAFSTNTDIFLYDVALGESRNISGGGGYDTDPVWSPDGKHLAWISMKRDGYEADRQRIMVAEADGTGIRELTEGFIYDAGGICWTPDSRTIVFPSTVNAIGKLCAVDVEDGSKGVRTISPDGKLVSYSTPFSITAGSDSLRIYTSFNSMTFPTELICVNVPEKGEPAINQLTSENGHILSQLKKIKLACKVIKTPEGEDLNCWVLFPPDFDAEKPYPVIEMFNGGPQTSLDQSWSYRWNFYLMAQKGYVVLLPNRHGDSGFGQEWKEQISGDYQGLNMQDYLITAKWAKEHKWCGKIAGVGASYGGFSVYNIMGMHDGLFDCFIAHAGIFNEKQLWYTTEEAWFGNWDNGGLREYAYEEGHTGPEGDGITFGGMQQAGAPYADVAKTRHHYENDPESRVTKWNTPILCIHGMMDYRIPYEQAMAAFNAAQMMGVPSKLIVFPEENHWILKPQNSLFWHNEFYAWLEKYIKD